MARWALTIFVALLVSCIPTDWVLDQPASQTQVHIEIAPSPDEARPIGLAESLGQRNYAQRRLQEQCQDQPNIMWCVGYKEFHEPLTEETIKTTDTRVRANFTYVADSVDSWQAHSHAVANTRAWVGDCDDLSTTTLDMMARHGQPLDRMWLVLVAAKVTNKLSGRLDHLIAVVEDNMGKFWVVGDTSGVTVELKDVHYRPLSFMSTNDLEWHAAENNDAFAVRFGVAPWTLGNGQPRLEPGTMRALPNEVSVPVENG